MYTQASQYIWTFRILIKYSFPILQEIFWLAERGFISVYDIQYTRTGIFRQIVKYLLYFSLLVAEIKMYPHH